MTISKYLKYYIPIILFFIYTSLAYAGFQISEVMYDASGTDDGHEWIEVQNSGQISDDLSKWYLFTDNSKHTLVSQGQVVVPAYGYAVIAQNPAKFKSDYPSFSGILLDSSWTDFNNTSETIGLKDPQLTLADSVIVNSSIGASGDGNSLQKVDGVFVSSIPTPGLVNVKSTQVVAARPMVTDSSAITKSSKKSRKTSADKNSDIVDLNNLSQNTNNTQNLVQEDKNPKKDMPISVYPYIGLAGVVILGSSATIALHRRSAGSGSRGHINADDIEIID